MGRLASGTFTSLAVLAASLGMTMVPTSSPLEPVPPAVRRPTPPIAVTIGDRLVHLSRNSTLRDVVSRFDLNPAAGSLLDVDGQPLRVGVYPGQVLLDGRTSPDETPLNDGDRIEVVDGLDRTEPLVHEVFPVPGGAPANPQFYVASAPGKEVITKGQISGKVVSTVFQATGPVRRTPAVALTFDDGPWPGSTDQVLSILDRFGVKATFFLIGRQAQAHPDLVREEIGDGMVVGDHTWDHPLRPPFATLPSKQIKSEIAGTKYVLESLGVTGCLFRPPGGSYSREVVDVAGSLHCRVVLWSVDPKDWKPGRTAAEIAKSVLSAVRPGSIILLHDGGGDRSATIAALPRIIKAIQKMGLKIVPLSLAAA